MNRANNFTLLNAANSSDLLDLPQLNINMIAIETLPQKEVIPGFRGRFVHTEHATLGFWEIEKGATLPLHKHMHEQITEVREGEFELTFNGETKIYTPGMLAVIPPFAEHSGKALTNCKLLDIFLPVREDYKAL